MTRSLGDATLEHSPGQSTSQSTARSAELGPGTDRGRVRSVVVDTRPAGPGHQVVSVEGGSGYRRRPCGGCPWKVSQTGSFPAEAFIESARTAYDVADQQFGCHESPPDQVLTCAGFLLRGAENNLAHRLDVITGSVDPDQVSDVGELLHGSYREMAVANGVDPDHPALERCR